jgi:hypothetical protein
MAVEQIVRAHLSIAHRDNPEGGCPSAALLHEIGRPTAATKRAHTDRLLGVIDDIAERLAPDDPGSARVKTLGVFALMGTLEVSRARANCAPFQSRTAEATRRTRAAPAIASISMILPAWTVKPRTANGRPSTTYPASAMDIRRH